MISWYLLYSKPRQEACALENLERQGFECFLPLVFIEKLRRKLIVVVQEPLFPRYLFIRLDASQEGRSWNPIRSTTGVSRLVTFGHVPAKVDDELVEVIRASVTDAGVCQRHFEPGEVVRINDGPFAGLEAVYQCPTARPASGSSSTSSAKKSACRSIRPASARSAEARPLCVFTKPCQVIGWVNNRFKTVKDKQSNKW